MAGPITWRNVGGDGGRAAISLLNGGQNQIQGAADGLLRTLDQYRKQNVLNAGIIKADNTQNFLDQVAAVGGADQLANPEVAAQLDQSRLQYGNNIDRGVARGAVADRLGQLQSAAVKTQQYNDVQQEVAQRPVLEDLAQKLYSGDTAGYNQILDTQNLRNEDKLRQQLAQRTDDVINQGYRAAGEKRAINSEGRAIASFDLSQQVGKENLANTREERSYRAGQRELASAAEAIKSVADESTTALALKQSKNIFANGSSDPNKDAQTILKNAGLDKGEFDSYWGSNIGDRQDIQKATTALIADGVTLKRDGKDVKVPIPPALIEQYFASTKGEVFKSGATGLTEHFTNMFKDNPELAARAFDGIDAKKEHNDLIKQLKTKERELRLSKNPNLSSTLRDIQVLRDKAAGDPPLAAQLLPDRNADVPLQWPPKQGANFY